MRSAPYVEVFRLFNQLGSNVLAFVVLGLLGQCGVVVPIAGGGVGVHAAWRGVSYLRGGHNASRFA